ncbi:MAG: bifunctional folylpolyglutamate synthase/dihydrofolate synthase [Acidobacteriota bacterium]|nr:bifunctional folylpolyglutamate synthase/dihydrofolate synthase [Acidobacteriota bacterium]
MNYPDSVRFLYSLGKELKTSKIDLERITILLEALGNPHRRGRFVHVAGTNGKGSTCAMIESCLRAAGMRTGLYTSPHLLEPTERIRICGVPVSPEEFAAAFDRVHQTAERLLAIGKLDLHPTYFETVTAMAFSIFGEEKLDISVIEVGLGGRLDATNVVHPELTIITPIDFDHEAFLGKSVESIAAEKAGILKAGIPAVFAEQRTEAAAVLEAKAKELNVAVTHSRDLRIAAVQLHARGSTFRANGMHIACPLAGLHQVENARTAICALRLLQVPEAAIERGIASVAWPGRLERLSEDPEIVVDGAHNPAGARALAAYIDQFYSHRPIGLIYGAMRDKAVEEVVGVLFPRFAEVIVTAPAQARALDPAIYASLIDHPNLRVARDLETAIGTAVHNARNLPRPLFITGSLFLVAEARKLLV